MNKGQREKPDGVVDGSKPTKSPIIKFFKIVGIIAIVIVLLIGISIAYVLYSDTKAEQERFDKTQAKAETWVSNRKPNLVLIRNDFGKTEKISIWFVNDTDRHVLVKDDKQFYEMEYQANLNKAYGLGSILDLYGKGGSFIGKDGKTYSDCKVTSVMFNSTLYDTVQSQVMEPWNLPWNTCNL